jgi:citrate/tricarballylate utilization protein
MRTTEALHEADRLMTICNACRYCEGLCAVFPAMEMRRTFAAGDLYYLANLCHQCGACLPDCQYSPPHQFDVNVPRALAKLRNETYAHHAWPRALSVVFARNGLYVALATAISVALFIVSFVAFHDSAVLFSPQAANFYKFMPHAAMAWLFGLVAIYVIVAFVFSLRAFWRGINADVPPAGLVAMTQAARAAGELKYLGGGGGGCMSENERPSAARRTFHHLTFYGFLLCFAATCVATVYHYAFGWEAPYAPYDLPVLLGILGGIGLLVGPAGLFVLARQRNVALTDPRRTGMDTAFVVMLFLTGLTGLLLLILRDTSAMGILLSVHLGVVLGLFLSLPYGKFVHGLYRYLALVKFAAEKWRGVQVE